MGKCRVGGVGLPTHAGDTFFLAIHLIAISPTGRCFPFLFMSSFSFPAI